MRKLLATLLCLIPLLGSAFTPLPADQAFAFKATAAEQIIQLHWSIQPGYFLYHDHFKYQVISPKDAQIGRVLTPQAETLQRQGESLQIYRNQLQIAVPVLSHSSNAVTLDVSYQGCTDVGFCYPPTQQRVHLNILDDSIQLSHPQSNQDRIQSLLEHSSLPLLLLSFLGFGLLLAFTPCVLPMIPILSAIIAGQQDATRKRALVLSTTYVLSMSLTYAIAGAFAGYIGTNLQAALQTRAVLIPFTLLIAAMALALFDCYQFSLPGRWQDKLNNVTQHQRGGSLWRVAGMGAIATLVVSPCVTPPLIGALAYISHSGNVLLGGSALFVLGFGMGLPLMAIGWFGQQFLPKAGAWMTPIKHFLGFAMLGLAISLLGRLLPELTTQLFWVLLALSASSYALIVVRPPACHLRQLIILVSLCGFAGTGYLAHDTWQTWQQCKRPEKENGFVTVTRADAVAHLIQTAHRPVLLDFYADWCTSCKLIEKHVFSDPEVKQALKGWLRIRADVTANNAVSRVLLKRYQVIAPPALLFFDAQGKQRHAASLVGDISKDELLPILMQ